MCQHCDRPPCIDVCPTSATYLNPEGIVAQIYPRCIGCRYCTNACPYAVKVFNWTTPDWPESMAAMHNPDVSLRPQGRGREVHVLPSPAEARRASARAPRGASWRADDYVPACVQTCPADAMVFGDLDDPHSDGRGAGRRAHAHSAGWRSWARSPKVIYLREGNE